MQWTFFVRFHFTEHEVLLVEGEKWRKQKALHIYEWGQKQGIPCAGTNVAFSFHF